MIRSILIRTSVVLLSIGCNNDVSIAEKQPVFSASPQNTDLGTVTVGEEHLVPLRLASLYSDLQVIGVEVQNIMGNYCFYNGSLPTIAAGTNLEIEISYVPEVAGLHQCKITVKGDTDPPEHELMIFAHAVTPNLHAYPNVLDFGMVEVGESETATLFIHNDSPISTDITSFNIGDSQFSVLQPPPITLEAESTALITVEFTPTSESAADSTFTALLDSPASLQSIELIGNNCALGNPSVYDVDADGYTSCGGDCDDGNPTVSPRSEEICDQLDNDCDGTIDEGTDCFDDDGDGLSELDGDCNDSDINISSSQSEIPANGIDDDCDGVVDDESIDLDGDGYSEYGGDCDDTDSSISPAAVEIADSIDNNCDGTVDENTENYDDDGDGYSEYAGDCDDNNTAISPDAIEAIDGVDENCNGLVDDGTTVSDDDGDGYSEYGGDCDDTSFVVSPASAEIIGNGVDDNCDGIVE